MSSVPPRADPTPQPAAAVEHDALAPGTRFGEFEIRRVLGVGGFGIVYLAWDHSLEREVALKEYMPAALAARGAGPLITVRSSSFAETYAIGLRSFVNEARLLARFDHPSLVKVYRFWEDNATAYMVMPFLQGVTLRDTRRRMAHAPHEPWIRSVMAPILGALELLHREGVYHRDIAPDNVLLPHDGPPVLLDFGAARRVIGDRTQSLTAILKPSYAPIEQYAEMTQLRQGPWTDLYALGAVVHFLLFGVPPAPATARAVQDEADTIAGESVAGVSPHFLETIAWMLAVRPNQRPQSVEALRAVLDGHAPVPASTHPTTTLPPPPPTTTAPPSTRPGTSPATSIPPMPPGTLPPATRPPFQPSGWAPMPSAEALAADRARAKRASALVAGGLVAAVLAIGAWQLFARRDAAPEPTPPSPEAQAASAPASSPVAAAAAAASASVAAVSNAASANAAVVVDVFAASTSAAPSSLPSAKAASTANGAIGAIASSSPLRTAAASVPMSAASAGRSRVAVRPVATATEIDATAAAASPSPATVAPSRAASSGSSDVAPATAREACGKRTFIAMAVCLDEKCEEPRFRGSAECAAVLDQKKAREYR